MLGLSTLTIIFSVSPLSPFLTEGEEGIYITSGDVIRNFQLESFNDELITSGGTVPSYENRLKFEVGSTWVADPDTIDVQYLQQVGDTVYANYRIAFENDINIYTNARLDDVVQEDKSIDEISESFHAGSYNHFNGFSWWVAGWNSYITWKHMDVGDIRSYNSENNLFQGELKMSFDIDQNPLPDTLEDENGNVAQKQFGYIGISSVSVSDMTYGSLSNEVPTVVGILPSEFQETVNSVSGGSSGSIYGSYYNLWDPNIQLSESVLIKTFDFGIQPQTVGSSLNPKTKSGNSLYDPRTSEQSSTDCSFTYNVGSLSPLVEEYGSTLSYDKQEVITIDRLDSLIPFAYSVVPYFDSDTALTYTRTTALHCTNRYIHTTIRIVFSIWTSYVIETANEDEYDGLEYPQEYYDNLVFDSAVDGFGGASQYTTGYGGFTLFGLGAVGDIIIIIIIAAVVGIIIFIGYRWYKKRSGIGSANITIKTGI